MRKMLVALAALFLAVPAAAQVVVPPPAPGGALPSPDWPYAPADGDKGPAVGGRAYQRYRIASPTAVLAPLDQVARLTSPPGVASDVAADPLYGDTRLTVTLSSFNAEQLRPAGTLASSVNASGQLVRIWTKPISNVDPRLSAYKIRLYSTGSPSSPGANYHEFNAAGLIREGQKGAEQRWGSFTIPVSAFTVVGSGADLTAVTWAMVEVQANSSAGMTIAVGNIELVANALTKAKMIIAFDDQFPATIAYASRAMARYGFKGVLYVSPAVDLNRTGKLTSATLKNLHDYLGWQIASQAYSTEANTGPGGIDVMTSDQRTADVAKLRNWQNGLGLSGGNHGSYYSNVGVTDMIAYPMFRQAFRSMRAYYFGEFNQVETYPWGDPMRIRAMGAGEFQWGNNSAIYTTYWKNHIDRARAQLGVGFLVFHGGLDGSLSNWRGAFDQMLAYLDANRATIDVVTVEDLETP
ncbi:hypothetical protein DRN02_007605 [Sphingomonas paucimobilis]|uniref:hypothetical protein n=1 Tax=Sphingomonas paucimobilis TaxID=13689 RepID=UPI000DE4C94D|nr:hypothetical protein [Sphingomonas paucimobilis]QBE91892.1 hypothetical protein DRN02_007605 [Sphingomonas paucimobilis]